MESKMLVVRLKEKYHKKLKVHAAVTGRSIQAIVEQAVIEYLKGGK